MTPESTRYLKLLERRLDLLNALARTLTQHRSDFIVRDLAAMERRVAEQDQICSRIRALDADLSALQTRCVEQAGLRPAAGTIFWPGSADGDARQDQQIQNMLGRVATAQADVTKLNDAHRVMLRRSGRTVRVLMNFFNSFAPTYSVPTSAKPTYEERV